MRFFLCAIAALLVAAPITCVANSRSAPADEYFGRLGESVLGIRNALDAIDREGDGEMLSPQTLANLDDQQDAIVALEQKYPNDPWLPAFLSRLSGDYARAGESSTPRAQVVAEMIDGTYSTAPVAHASNAVLASVVSDIDEPGLPSLTIPSPTIVDESDDSSDLLASQAWQTFDSSRGIASTP